jgi:hypothetical protein
VPPQVNATVTAVTGASAAAGRRDDWDNPGQEPAGGAAAKWAGDIAAYYREKTDRADNGGTLNIFTRRTLIIDTADYRAMQLDSDDVITFTHSGVVEHAAAVSIAVAELDGIPPELQTTRIELAPA